MRTIVTGQIGMHKKPYLDAVADLAGRRGGRIEVFHIGNLMYAEAPDIRSRRILDLPLSRLNALRRAVFKDIIAQTSPASEHPNVIINTHATFRWRHGLFSAFDFDQIQLFEPDMFICLVDNVETVHHRLHAEHDIDATLKDCMVWREEEILATELLAQAVGCPHGFYILSRALAQQLAHLGLIFKQLPSIEKTPPGLLLQDMQYLSKLNISTSEAGTAMAGHNMNALFGAAAVKHPDAKENPQIETAIKKIDAIIATFVERNGTGRATRDTQITSS